MTIKPAQLDAAMPIALALNAYLNLVDEWIAFHNETPVADTDADEHVFRLHDDDLSNQIAEKAQLLARYGFSATVIDALKQERMNAI
jgi:alpha-D-ribose 1-methylphosphonate 5-triphosphate synthase subunit PhnH